MQLLKRYIKSHSGLFQFLKHVLVYIRYIRSIGKDSPYMILSNYKIEKYFLVSKKNSHCYFGYYDKSPVSKDDKNVLFLNVSKTAHEGDNVNICVYDINNHTHYHLGTTNTWNWQQGAMEQWIDEHTVSYNRYDSNSKDYQTVRIDIKTRKESVTRRAAYFYNKDFTRYLSLNFYRLDLYAKGYGYPFQVDSLDIDKDGIWEVDVVKNSSLLLLSLKDVMAFEEKDYMCCQHYINHVAYTPDEKSIIFIHRWQVKGGEFVSRLLKYELTTKELVSLLDNGHVSHYCWKSDNELLIYATNSLKEKGYMIVNVLTGETSMVAGLPTEDGHPSYSKDGKWILTDTYPNNRREQFLFLYNTEEHQLYKLDQLHSPFKYFNENRCDLHPRWSVDDKYVCVDNTQTKLRSLKIYQVKK